jgi:hypothetical protein
MEYFTYNDLLRTVLSNIDFLHPPAAVSPKNTPWVIGRPGISFQPGGKFFPTDIALRILISPVR